MLRALGNQVLESHAAAPVVVRIRGVDPDGDVSVKTTVRGLLDADDAAPLPFTPITLPVDGRPDKYPFDWFSFYGYGQLEFTPAITVPKRLKPDEEDQDPSVLPVSFDLLAGPGVGDFTMRGTAATAPPNGGH